MKKLLSIALAAIMTVSVFALSVVPAMAADTVNSPTATTAKKNGVSLKVNGKPNNRNVTYRTTTTSTGAEVITFAYESTGTDSASAGEFVGWSQNLTEIGLVEGEDFTIVQNADGTLTVTLVSEKAIAALENGKIEVNAIVKDEPTTASSTATTKKNDSSKSPATGIVSSAVAGSVAVAFAGAAVLAATKKKDAE